MEFRTILLCFMVLIIIILLVLVAVGIAGNPISSIMYHHISPYHEMFSKSIMDCRIIKTGINYACMSTFGKNRWSHWALLCITDSGKVILSPAKKGSLNIYNATNMVINNIDGQYMLIPKHKLNGETNKQPRPNKELLGKWLIETNKYDLNTLLSDAIQLFYDTIRGVKYTTFGTNCQFITQYFLYKYAGASFPETDPINIFIDVTKDMISGVKIKH